MSAIDDAARVAANIGRITERNIAAVQALSEFEMQNCLNKIIDLQARNRYWTNRTYQALTRLFGRVIKEKDATGFLIAHGVNYGVYLELANNREHAAIAQNVEIFASQLIEDIRKLFSD